MPKVGKTHQIKEFYNLMDFKHKDVMYFEGETHFDLYYKPEFVNPIVDRITKTFQKVV